MNKVGVSKPEVVKNRGRVDMESRIRNAYEALNYNILRRKDNEELQEWKSYPGIGNIVRMARDAFENNNRHDIDKLLEMMKIHESQQTAPIVATIAMLLGSKLKNEVTKEIRESVGDMISWDVPIIKNKKDWPERKRFTTKIIYESDEEEEKMKRIVHGYLGEKASREMEPRPRIKEGSSSLRVESLLGIEVMETEVGSKSEPKLSINDEFPSLQKEDRNAEVEDEITYICSLMLFLCGAVIYKTCDVMRCVWVETVVHALQEDDNKDNLKTNTPGITPDDMIIDDPSNVVIDTSEYDGSVYKIKSDQEV